MTTNWRNGNKKCWEKDSFSDNELGKRELQCLEDGQGERHARRA
jgi:hypothetical protein